MARRVNSGYRWRPESNLVDFMPPSATPSQARWAVAVIFFVHGLVWGSWVPHIPLAKERLDVGTGVFGLALLAMAGGAVVSMPIAGALINRFGSAPMTSSSTIFFSWP